MQRVCILTETYFPVVGGGETQAKAIAKAFVEGGNNVLVLTRRTDKSQARREILDGAQIHRLPPVGRFHLKKWGLFISSIWGLWLHRDKYDLIFVSGFRVVGAAAVWCGHRLGKKVILKADSVGEMSGDFFINGLQKWGLSLNSAFIQRLLRMRNRRLHQADQFVAISSVLASELENAGIVPNMISRIPNSVDVDLYRPVPPPNKKTLRQQLNLPTDAPLVIYTGRLVHAKGLFHLLEAWRLLTPDFPTAYLLLVGTGGLSIDNCEAELKAFVATHHLNTVLFSGQVSNVVDYLQASDIFAFPSENEAFGISLIEAMACGLPCVTTPAGGLADIVEHQQNGLIVSPDYASILEALSRLLTDEELAAKLGMQARRDSVSRYSLSMVTTSLKNLFDELVE